MFSMLKNFKTVHYVVLAVVLLVFYGLGLTTKYTIQHNMGHAAMNQTFSDVPENHWARETIQWGVKEGVITGYPDGTFRPTQQVTEAEFLTMFIRTFDELPTPSNLRHWADPAYNYALDRNWPVLGAKSDSSARNTAITRGTVAHIIAGAQGINVGVNDSVQHLLNEGLAHGKTGELTIDGYAPNDFLTRAEAITFIKNLKDAGVEELVERPIMPSDPVRPTKPVDVPQEIKDVAEGLENIINNDSTYEGTEVRYAENNVVAKITQRNKTIVSYTPVRGSGSYDSIYVRDAMTKSSRDLGLKLLELLGYEVTDEIANAVHGAPDLMYDDRKDSTFYSNGTKIVVSPHPVVSNEVALFIYSK